MSWFCYLTEPGHIGDFFVADSNSLERAESLADEVVKNMIQV